MNADDKCPANVGYYPYFVAMNTEVQKGYQPTLAIHNRWSWGLTQIAVPGFTLV